MIADPPTSPSTEPDLGAVASRMEAHAAAVGDAMLFELSQLLSLVHHEEDTPPWLVHAAHRLATLWLLTPDSRP